MTRQHLTHLTLPLLLLASCAPREPDVRVIVVQNPSTPASQAPEASQVDSKPATPPAPVEPTNATETVTETKAADAQSPGPSNACSFASDETGILVGNCGDLEIQVFSGFSATPKAAFLANIAGDNLGRFSNKTTVQIAGTRTAAWQLGQREKVAKPMPFGGVRYEERTSGPFLREGLFAKFKVKASGSVGVLCHGESGTNAEARCLEHFTTFAENGVPSEVRRASTLSVAGVNFQLRGKRCWAPGPREVYCFLDGGLRWHTGTPEELLETEDSIITKSGLAHEDGIAPVREEQRCSIGGAEARCTRVAVYGALENPSKYYYFGTVPSEDTTTMFTCHRWAFGENQKPSAPCSEVFGAFAASELGDGR